MLGALPKSAHPGAKRALAEIWNAEDRRHAQDAAKVCPPQGLPVLRLRQDQPDGAEWLAARPCFARSGGRTSALVTRSR